MILQASYIDYLENIGSPTWEIFHCYQISISDVSVSEIAFEISNDSSKGQESDVIMRNDIRSNTQMILCL